MTILLVLLLVQPLGFFPESAAKQEEAEKLLLSIPTPDGFGAHLLYLTEEPHPAGSERSTRGRGRRSRATRGSSLRRSKERESSLTRR